jgi:transcriptional regulator with XRE-family HTH domain
MNRKLKAKIVQHFGTQSDFAQVIGADETLISKIVRGRRKLNPSIQRIWADVLGCKPKDIFTDESRDTK